MPWKSKAFPYLGLTRQVKWQEEHSQGSRKEREAGRSREWAGGLTAKDPITQLSDGRYQARITQENGTRKAFYGGTPGGSIRTANRSPRQAQQGASSHCRRQADAGPVPEDWLAAIKGNVRQKTYQGYESYIRVHVQPAIGKHRMAKLNPLHLQRLYSQKLEQGLSPTTVRHIHATLHRALDQAVRWGILYRNVAELVDAPRRAQREMAALSPEQAEGSAGRGRRGSPRSPLHSRHQHRHEAGRDAGAPVERGRPGGRSLARSRAIVQRTKNGIGFSEPKTAGSRRQIALVPAAVAALRAHQDQAGRGEVEGGSRMAG